MFVMKKTICAFAAAMPVILWGAPSFSGTADFTRTDGNPPALKNWSLNPVKLSKTPDPVRAEARVIKTEDGVSVLEFTGGDTTMVHYFMNDFIPARGNRDKVEISLQARGKGVVMLGFYNYNGQTWLQTNASYSSVPAKWTSFTATLPVPFKTREKLTDRVRILIGCQAKSRIEVKNISWKLISLPEEKAEIPAF